MNLTPRAARQLQTLDPDQAAVLLDALERHPARGATSIVPVTIKSQVFRCFVGRHRDGAPVLLGIARQRPEGLR